MTRRRRSGQIVVAGPELDVPAPRADDVRGFVERLALPHGRPLELAPFQQAVLSRIYDRDGAPPLELVIGRDRLGRSRAMARAIAAAVLLGEDVAIACSKESEAIRMLELAGLELERLNGILGLNLDVAAMLQAARAAKQ